MAGKTGLPTLRIALFLTACALCASAAASAATVQQATNQTSLLQAVNAARIEHGLLPLRLDSGLDQAAEAHTLDMLANHYFGHGDFGSRMVALGLNGNLGENLAWGTGRYARARSIVHMWLTSAEHRANVLRPEFRRIGFGVATGPFQGRHDAIVVTADFGD